jgi:transposase
MAGAYSADLRERVVDAVNAGKSRRGASVVFKVSASSAIRWAQRFRETGECKAKPTGGDRRSRAIEAHKDWLLALVGGEPDLTLEEIRGRLAASKGFGTSVSALWRFFDRHEISFKKTSSDWRSAYGGRNGSRYPEPEGSGRRVFGGLDPVKKRGPWAVADFRVVTPVGDPD